MPPSPGRRRTYPTARTCALFWRSDVRPDKLNSAVIAIDGGHLLPAIVAGNPDWIGRVTGLALAIHGTALTQPIRVRGVIAKPMGARELFGDRAGEWLAFEGWNGASINTIAGGADIQDLPLPMLLAAALLLSGAASFVWRRFRPTSSAAPLAAILLGTFVLAWFVLDARWTWNLARQVRLTAATYAGKDVRDKHLAMEDGPLYAFIEKARAVMPATPARVFVVADLAYFRDRAAYHLYPHNVFAEPASNAMPPASRLRPGDWLLVYQHRGVQFDRTLGQAALGRQPGSCRRTEAGRARLRAVPHPLKDRMDIAALVRRLPRRVGLRHRAAGRDAVPPAADAGAPTARRVDDRLRLVRGGVPADALDARGVAGGNPVRRGLRRRADARRDARRALARPAQRTRSRNVFAAHVVRDFAGADLHAWQRAAWVALLAWLALRYALLLAEVLWRPLYPWDAWTQWATKARVWFELKSMVPFVPLAEWLQPGSAAYIDTAPHYPATVPLLQVWSALLLGRWDDALINLPWWITAVAFAAARSTAFSSSADCLRCGRWSRRGSSRRCRSSTRTSRSPVTPTWRMAAYLTLGVLAALQSLASRQWRDAALALLLLVACVTIKNPGKVWLAVLIPGAVAALVPRNRTEDRRGGHCRRDPRAAASGANEPDVAGIPAAPRIRTAMARARRSVFRVRQLASPLVRRDRRRHPRAAPVVHARDGAAHARHRHGPPVPLLRLRIHQRRALGRGPVDGEPRLAASRAAGRRLDGAALPRLGACGRRATAHASPAAPAGALA